MDKGDVVRTAASTAVKAILKPVPPESMRVIINQLEEILESGKWRTKVGVLNSIKGFVAIAPTQVADLLGDLLPKVEKAMHDTKSDVCPSFAYELAWVLIGNRYRVQRLNALHRSVQRSPTLISSRTSPCSCNAWPIPTPSPPVSKLSLPLHS